jgi:hypothetical protein
MVTPRENMQRAVERLLMRLRQTHAIEQTVGCSGPVLWQTPATRHATPGEGLTAWRQIKVVEGSELQVELCNQEQDRPVVCPVIWDDCIELARIAAAIRLRDMTDAKTREALAIKYQLVTSETNLILVHQRAEGEKAEDLPELHHVRPMLAAGWQGNGSIQQLNAMPLQVLRTGYDNVPFEILQESRSMKFGIESDSSSIMYSKAASTPAVWRTGRTQAAARVDGMSSSGMDDIEIPAFLRKAADDTSQSVEKTAPTAQQKSVKPAQTPQASADELIATLHSWPTQGHPVQTLLSDFNLVAMNHTQFRSALAVCLKSNQAGYLQWLVMKHMKAAGSAAPVWAVFIAWAAEHFSVHLDRHADRLLRDFMKSIKPVVQDDVRADLNFLLQDAIL